FIMDRVNFVTDDRLWTEPGPPSLLLVDAVKVVPHLLDRKRIAGIIPVHDDFQANAAFVKTVGKMILIGTPKPADHHVECDEGQQNDNPRCTKINSHVDSGSYAFASGVGSFCRSDSRNCANSSGSV